MWCPTQVLTLCSAVKSFKFSPVTAKRLEIGLCNELMQRFNFHTSRTHDKTSGSFPEPKKWPTYNEKVFPPQKPEEERRPAVIIFLFC